MITCTKDCSVISAEKSWHVELKCSIYKKNHKQQINLTYTIMQKNIYCLHMHRSENLRVMENELTNTVNA